MNAMGVLPDDAPLLDSGLLALCGIAAYFRIPADPVYLARELALGSQPAAAVDIARAAQMLGLKVRILKNVDKGRLLKLPTPAIAQCHDGSFVVLGGVQPSGLYRFVDPVTRQDEERDLDKLDEDITPQIVLIQRRIGGAGIDP